MANPLGDLRVLIVLDRLRRGEHAGVKGGRTLELFHHNLAFVDHPVDSVTDFASCGLFDEFENPLEPLDLMLSLALVFLEGSLQLFRLDSFRRLRKSGEDLSFRRSRCLSGSREEVFKHLLRFTSENSRILAHGALAIANAVTVAGADLVAIVRKEN